MVESKRRENNVEYPSYSWLVFLGTCFIIHNISALEVLEQCSLNSGPNQKLATVRGTISYHIKLVNVPPDFWKEGVGTSKKIINKILKKITSYEDDMNKDFDDEIQSKILERFKKISNDNLWFDEKKQKPVNREAFCASVDEMKAKERKVLKYTCTESEQLYGIGYHKVYEDCKDDSFLSQFNVDWSICLHAHYPWVDMTQWSICVIKSFKNDFLACFCMEKDGKVEKRSFCITKFECFLHGQGLNNQNTALVVTDSCKNSIQYFMEVNVKTKKSFKKAQDIDKLRVRALYHPESPCKDKQFSAQFDVGQLDTENLISGIEVHTPKLVEYKMIPDEPVEPLQCGMPEHEEKIDPVVRQRHLMLNDIFKERMATSVVIWIPGIFFLYCYLSMEKPILQLVFMWIVQCKVITLGLYNVAMAPTLWRSKLFSKGDIGNTEITFLLLSFLITVTWLNRKEIAERFLCFSVVYFIGSSFLSNLTAHMMTRESLNLMGILAFVFYTGFAMYIGYHISLLLSFIRQVENNIKENKIVPIRRKEQYKKKNARKKKSEQKINMTEVDTKLQDLLPVKHRCEKVIVCNWNCNITDSTDHLALHCSNKCLFVYHIECWGLYLTIQELREERYILEYPCSQADCAGKFVQMIWFNKFGDKIRTLSVKKKSNKTGMKPKHISPIKVFEKKELLETDISENRNVKDFKCQEEIHESTLGVSTNMLTSMDFQKIYKIEREFDEPFKLNEEWENGSTNANNFGTIGGERKNRNQVESKDSFNYILDDQGMFEELLGNTNIEYSVEQSSPQQSKFLSMIKRNNSIEENIENFEADFFNGFTLNLEMLNTASSSLTYLPNCKADTKSESNDIKLETNSLAYISGTPGSWLMEEVLSEGVELVGIEEEDLEEEISPKNIDEQIEISATSCPFTKMIKKHAPKYAVELIESAVKSLMIEIDPSSITIPYFQELVIKKLEEDIDAVYISDDDMEEDEEVEECLICTELLEKDLQSLEPCKHIFHLACIKQWLGKDTSCPKCRAIVIQIE